MHIHYVQGVLDIWCFSQMSVEFSIDSFFPYFKWFWWPCRLEQTVKPTFFLIFQWPHTGRLQAKAIFARAEWIMVSWMSWGGGNKRLCRYESRGNLHRWTIGAEPTPHSLHQSRPRYHRNVGPKQVCHMLALLALAARQNWGENQTCAVITLDDRHFRSCCARKASHRGGHSFALRTSIVWLCCAVFFDRSVPMRPVVVVAAVWRKSWPTTSWGHGRRTYVDNRAGATTTLRWLFSEGKRNWEWCTSSLVCMWTMAIRIAIKLWFHDYRLWWG